MVDKCEVKEYSIIKKPLFSDVFRCWKISCFPPALLKGMHTILILVLEALLPID